MPLGFFDGDNAFLADLFHGLRRSCHRFRFRHWPRWCRPGRFRRCRLTGFERAFKSATTLPTAKIDAALQVHRVHASGNRLHAFTDDRLGEHGGGGGAVAGDCRWSWKRLHAPSGRRGILELVLEFDFLGDSDAVLGDARGTERLLSMTTLRPLGPNVTFTASARISTPRRMRSRASRPNFTSLAASCQISFQISTLSFDSLLKRARGWHVLPPSPNPISPRMPKDVAFLHDDQVFAARP